MGQQQLLLVILVTIIVGIATVVAINTFGSAADNANVDAVRQDLLNIASAAQGYYIKPEMMGGGGSDFDGITFNDLGSVPGTVNSGTELANENAVYTIGTITAGANGSVVVSAVPASAGGSIQITIEPNDATMGAYTPPSTGGGGT